MTLATEPLPDTVFDLALGAVAWTMTDQTEADPAAVLVHLLAGVGAAVGPNVFCDWSGHRTPARLFALAIGGTGSGKGISERIARRLLRDADPTWTEDGIVGGLVSGEGLLAALGGESGAPSDDLPGQPPLPITGRSLLAIEPEFGRVLASSKREGATLSHLLRELWDSDRAASMSRQRPLRVKGANLSLVGHITPTELERLADGNAIENGFLNRFLPIMVSRGDLRPFGAPASAAAAVQREESTGYLRSAIEHGRQLGRVPIADDARSLWVSLYNEFAPEKPFLVGALQTRAIAHVQRLALLFAIGDQENEVRRVHLLAAAALWRRSAAAWVHLYGERMGDPLAERLLAAIQGAGRTGLTRAEIRKVVGSNNVPARRIDGALKLLAASGKATVLRVPPANGGRPAEVWTGTSADDTDDADDDDADDATSRPSSLSSQSSHPSHANNRKPEVIA